MRITHEDKYHKESCFLTLTYDNDSLPHDNSLSIRELQNFIKRLRQNINRKLSKKIKIKYFAVGEYGEENARPHYHVILFGLGFTGHKTVPFQQNGKTYYYCMDGVIKYSWDKGQIQIGSLTHDSAQYITKYVLKNIKDYVKDELWDTMQKPFFISSKKLGHEWALDNRKQIEKLLYIPFRGQKRPVPEYYRQILDLDVTPLQDIAIRNNNKIIEEHMQRTGIEQAKLYNYHEHYTQLKELEEDYKNRKISYQKLGKFLENSQRIREESENFFKIARSQAHARTMHNIYLEKKSTEKKRQGY